MSEGAIVQYTCPRWKLTATGEAKNKAKSGILS